MLIFRKKNSWRMVFNNYEAFVFNYIYRFKESCPIHNDNSNVK